jgi:uncharacterized protein
MSSDELTLAEARRIALAAQGFDRPRPTRRAGISLIRNTIRRLGLLQIDYVNVLTPAHYQVLFSRLGPYQATILDDLVFRRREFTEQWAHEASIVPVETWPLLRHRMATHRVRPYGFESVMEELSEYVERVLEEVRTRGPLTADDLPSPEGLAGGIASSLTSLDTFGQTWFRSVPRAVLEAYFGRGALAVADRRPNFARAYDLAERVLPAEHHTRSVEREEAQRELLRQAAAALGVAAASELADYFRMSRTEARPRLAELVETGHLRAVRVEGWREPAYLYRDAQLSGEIDARALLSPFDPVIWHRARAARLFGFDYRFEIFVPQEKRRWGVYVLPFLLGDRLVARVDLKADRPGRSLQVLAAFAESQANAAEVAEALATELQTLAGWLNLDSVVVGQRGDLARKLAAACRA